MGHKLEMAEMKTMSSAQLLEKLMQEEDDLDDVIGAELQRRTLARLDLMTWPVVALASMAGIGLILGGLYATGLLPGRAPGEPRLSPPVATPY